MFCGSKAEKRGPLRDYDYISLTYYLTLVEHPSSCASPAEQALHGAENRPLQRPARKGSTSCIQRLEVLVEVDPAAAAGALVRQSALGHEVVRRLATRKLHHALFESLGE